MLGPSSYKLTLPEGAAKLPKEKASAGPEGGDAQGSGPWDTAQKPLGVYLHFPWCRKKCPYCDFLSAAVDPEQIPHEFYADAVIRELRLRAGGLSGRRLASVFLGGGTPSLWSPKELGRVLRAILEQFPDQEPELEISVECNPNSLSVEHARALRDQGVNRLSIGVQSLNAERLRFLGRLHSAQEGLDAILGARKAGLPRVSADLIHGVHGQSPEEAASEARQLVEAGVDHLSSYSLTIEPETQFGALARKGKLPIAVDDAIADCYLAVADTLQRLGFLHYEVSNYARPGQQCVHNLGYWQGRDYLGLGCGAWGTLPLWGLEGLSPPKVRYRNLPQPARYMAACGEGSASLTQERGGLHAEWEELTPEERLLERLLLEARLDRGLNPEEVARECQTDFWTPERSRNVLQLLKTGDLVWRQSALVVPEQRWLQMDRIVRALA